MNDQELNALLSDGSGSAAPPPTVQPGPQAAAPAPAEQSQAKLSDQALDRMLNDGRSKDEITGEDILPAFSGASPETAMNKSPVSAYDRMALSMGNESGNISYLSKRFDKVAAIPGSKELAVLKDGSWYRVDPKNGDGVDPWKLAKNYVSTARQAAREALTGHPLDAAKTVHDGVMSGSKDIMNAAATATPSYIDNPGEMVNDVASLGPEALGVGVALGADVLTGGAATTAGATVQGAVTAGIRTSLGRIVGTYDADVGQQVKDSAFEAILNAVGHKIMVGDRPTPAKIADMLPDIADAFNSRSATPKPAILGMKDAVADKAGEAASYVADKSKEGFKQVFAGLSVGVDNFNTMLENTQATKSLMKAVNDMTGGKVSAYHDEIVRRQTASAMEVAQNARTTLSSIYGKMKDGILNSVDDSFSANFDEPIHQSYTDAITKGLGKLVVTTEKKVAGKPDWITGLASEETVQEAKTLMGADAAEYIAKNGMKGAKFQLLDQAEMMNAIKKGAALGDEMGYLASDADAYGVVKEYFDHLGRFQGAAQRTGKDAAKALLEFKKVASDKAWSLANMEKTRDIPGVKAILDKSRTGIDNSILQGLDKAGVGDQFQAMNGTYNELAKQFSPLLNANYQYAKSGNMKVYENLLSTFTARPGKQTTNKFAVDAAISAAEENGLGGLAQTLANSKRMIQVGEAARAFNPLPSATQKNLVAGAVGAAASGHLGVATGMGVTAAARSPLMAKGGVALAQSAFKGQQFLAKLPKGQIQHFLNSPQALDAFTNAVVQSPQVRLQVGEQLNQVLQGASTQGQGQ